VARYVQREDHRQKMTGNLHFGVFIFASRLQHYEAMPLILSDTAQKLFLERGAPSSTVSLSLHDLSIDCQWSCHIASHFMQLKPNEAQKMTKLQEETWGPTQSAYMN
jgi:hypothetical protein